MESINFRHTTLWWHDLRATFGTRLAGTDHESFTGQLMGHSDLKTTQSVTSGQRRSVDGLLLWRPKQ